MGLISLAAQRTIFITTIELIKIHIQLIFLIFTEKESILEYLFSSDQDPAQFLIRSNLDFHMMK